MNLDKANIMDDLAAYKVARSVAKDKLSSAGKSGRKMLGFVDTADEYEITTGDAFDLSEYNVGLNIIGEDTQGFNLIVRQDQPNSLHKLPKDKLRRILSRILDTV